MDDDERKDYDSSDGSIPDPLDDPEDLPTPSGSPTISRQTRPMTANDIRGRLLSYPNSLPYEVESLAEMDARLDFILTRLQEAIAAKDWDVGFWRWHREVDRWLAMKYPLKRERRAGLVRMYFELAVSPGMEARLVEAFASMAITLVEKKNRISRKDIVLPWRPLYDILRYELFPKGRKTGLTNIAGALLSLTEVCQRFFHPSETDAMLEVILPLMDGNDINTVIATEAFLVHFLPMTHPQKWLPMMFRFSATFNSGTWDDQMLDLLSRLAELHTDPSVSDPIRLSPDYAYENLPEEDESAPEWTPETVGLSENGSSSASLRLDHHLIDVDGEWPGIWKDVGIFTEEEFRGIMTTCLKTMEGTKHGTGKHADGKLSDTMQKMKKPSDRVQSLAHLIVYCMANDAPQLPKSGAATPRPLSAMSTFPPKSNANGLLPPGTAGPAAPQKYLAGSKALDAVAKLITNCESLFHPSNTAQSSVTTSTFIWALAAVFAKRWKSEEKESCKTPRSRRLTKEIKREFCTSLRTVALLSMFSKVETTMALSHACLRYLSYLEPSLTIQSILDRAYPSLTGLEETHRTPAVLTCLAACSMPLMSREIYYLGGRNLVPLLELCLPGIDLNDPMKTVATTWFISNLVQFVSLADLTDYEPDEGADPAPWLQSTSLEIDLSRDLDSSDVEPPLPVAEENQALRYTTGSLSAWLTEYISRVLTLFENLPDQGGKSLRTGGKTEESVNSNVQRATAAVFYHLSDQLFDQALDQIYEYAKTTVRGNTVLVVAQVISSLAKVDFKKTFDKFFPLCRDKIHYELEQGASSVPTSSASLPSSSDTTLHAYMSIMSACLAFTDPSILSHQDNLVKLILFAVEKAKNERAWSILSRWITRILVRLTTCWTEDTRFINRDEWRSEDFKKNSHLYWGKCYRITECKIDWHTPSEPELAFATRLIDECIIPCLEGLESGIPSGPPSKAWTNAFCKDMSFLRHGLEGLHSFYLEEPSTKLGGVSVSDRGECPEEFRAPLPPSKAAFILTDPRDPKHQAFAALRDRIAKFLINAAVYLRSQGGDDSTDAVINLISTVSSFMLCQGIDTKTYAARKATYDLLQKSLKMHVRQKVLPRKVWVARAELYSAARSRATGWSRRRSALDDELIRKIMDFALSSYTRIRKHAQNTLDAISRVYDGTKSLVYPTILASLQKGVDADQMKGALYTIGGKSFASFSILDARFFGDFVITVLKTQDQEKASIQALVTKITEDTIIRTAEPSSLRSNVPNARLDAAVDGLVPVSARKPSDPAIVAVLRQSVEQRHVMRDAAFDRLVADLLDLAEKPSTHWRYQVFASRYLRALIRRDRPLNPRVAAFFVARVVDELPLLRHYAQLSLTKFLHFAKLRSLTHGSEEFLLLEKSTNPLKHTQSVTAEFAAEFLTKRRVPLADDDCTTPLFDKPTSGWLAWDKTITGHVLAPFDSPAFEWDPTSQEALGALREAVQDPAWWKKLVTWYAQEDARTYLSGDSINFIKSLSQAFLDQPFKMAKPFLDEFVDDKDSTRHKQRALAELVSGFVRGSKHWPGRARKELWEWLTPALPKMYALIRPDTLSCWTMFYEFNFFKRDPRRLQPMVDFVLETARSADLSAGSAFGITKALTFLNSLMRCLSWGFEPWTGNMKEEFFAALDNDYAEIRDLLADNLHRLEKLTWRVGCLEPLDFVEKCRDPSIDVLGLHRATDLPRIRAYVSQLVIWREERPSGPAGPSSIYDKTSLSLLRYMQRSVGDLNGAASFDSALLLLPEIFQMRELKDSPEMQKQAAHVLALLASVSPPQDTVKPLIFVLLQTLKSHASWHIRLHVLPVLATVYFRGLPLIDEATATAIMDTLTACLDDDNLEVRDVASSALSAVLRCSRRESIVVIKNRFQDMLRNAHIPKRRLPDGSQDPAYALALNKTHAAVLGIGAIVEAFPYTVPSYIPGLLADTLAVHASDPQPVSTTVRKIAAAFKASHTDTWEHHDKSKFTEDQLSSLASILSGTSYYA